MKQTTNVKQRLILGYDNKPMPQVEEGLRNLTSSINHELDKCSDVFLKVLDYLLQIEKQIQKTDPTFKLK